jgi:hypothetical protein
MQIQPGPLEFLFIMLFGGGFGMSSAVPPTEQDVVVAHVAPAESLFYMSWAGTGKPDAASQNHTEKLLAEPEIQDFLETAIDRFAEMTRTQGPNDPQVQQGIEGFIQLSKLVQGKPGAVYVSDFELNGNDPPTIRGAGLIRVEEDADAIKEVLERLQKLGTEQSPTGTVTSAQVAGNDFWRVQLDKDAPSITWGIVGKHLVLGIGDGSAEQLIGRMNGPAPKWLDEIHTKLPVPRVSTVTYIDVGRIVELFVEADSSSKVDAFMSRFGLDKMKTMMNVGGMDATGCVNRTLLTVDGPGTGLLSWMAAKPLATDDLKKIGRQSSVAVAMKLDPVLVYDLWLELVEMVEPRAVQRIQRNIEQVEQNLGVEIRADLLESIGDTWRLFAQPGPGGLITGWTLAVDVRDHKRLLTTQETLVNVFSNALEQAPPRSGAPTLESTEVDGIIIHTFDFGQVGMPIAPAWCVTEKDLIVTLTPQMLKRILGAEKNQPSLAEAPEVEPEVASGSRTLGMVYLNTKEVAQTLLPMVRMGLQAMNQQGRMPFRFDTANLPSAETVIDHLQPTVFVCRRTADGVEFESRQTLPGTNVAAVAPVGVALLLPAVQAAREAARRAQSTNNMKQIGLALHNYHSACGAFPAGYSADEDGKPLLSWRIHILPYIEEQNLYNEFHLDEPWDSEHNKKLIEKIPQIYQSPNSTAKPGMTNYLGASGADGIFVRPKANSSAGTRFAQITDGTSNTIMVVEVPEKSAVIWTQPADFAPTEKNLKEGLFGMRPGGAIVGFCDGSVRFLGSGIDMGVLKALFTKSGGEVIPEF